MAAVATTGASEPGPGVPSGRTPAGAFAAFRAGGLPLAQCYLDWSDCYEWGWASYDGARLREAEAAFGIDCARGGALGCVALGATQVASFRPSDAQFTLARACAGRADPGKDPFPSDSPHALACANLAALRAHSFDDLGAALPHLRTLCRDGIDTACKDLGVLTPPSGSVARGDSVRSEFEPYAAEGRIDADLSARPLSAGDAVALSDSILVDEAGKGAFPGEGEGEAHGTRVTSANAPPGVWCFPTLEVAGNVHCFFKGRIAMNLALDRVSSRIEQAGRAPGADEHRASDRNRYWSGQNLALEAALPVVTFLLRERAPLLPEEAGFWEGLLPAITARERAAGRELRSVTANAVSATRLGTYHHELLHALYFSDPAVREAVARVIHEDLPASMRREAFARLAPFYATDTPMVREGELFAYLAMREAAGASFVARVPGLLDAARAAFAARGLAARIEALAPAP